MKGMHFSSKNAHLLNSTDLIGYFLRNLSYRKYFFIKPFLSGHFSYTVRNNGLRETSDGPNVIAPSVKAGKSY
jgi:hypothetical protein